LTRLVYAAYHGDGMARITKIWAVCLGLLAIQTFAIAQMGPKQVHVAPVEARQVELTRDLVGTAEPVIKALLAAEQGGLVSERLVDEGQRIEKGVVLGRLDIDLLKAELAAAEAAHRSAQAAVKQAKAELTNRQREAKRLGTLYERKDASEKEYRDAITAVEVAEAVIQEREAQAAQREAQVRRLALMIEKSEMRAPVTGVITKRYIEAGQWIEQGDPVVEVVQLDPLFVRFNVPEALIHRVRKGDEARLRFDAMGGAEMVGKVEQIIPQADMASRTFTVKVLLPNADQAVMPGYFARVSVISKSEAPVNVVPRDAVMHRGGKSYVAVLRDGQAAIVPVEVGGPAGNGLVVQGELKAGEMVVTRGNEELRGGEQLIPLNLQPPPGNTTTQSTTQSTSAVAAP
jgi:membrane fusion protein (multidrug efflux system)